MPRPFEREGLEHRPQKTATSGSSGVDFLRRALDLTFFPELFEVRSRIGA